MRWWDMPCMRWMNIGGDKLAHCRRRGIKWYSACSHAGSLREAWCHDYTIRHRSLCTDNAAMIGAAAYYEYIVGTQRFYVFECSAESGIGTARGIVIRGMR